MRRTLPPVVLAALAFAACQSTPDSGSPVASAPVASNIVAEDDVDNAFTWLAARYDADGDGRVTAGEFDREGAEFARLDRNEDGVLDASDYPASSEGGGEGRWAAMPASFKDQMEAMYSGRAVMLTYFQPDEDATELSQDAMLWVFDELDTDESGDLDESEVACATDARPWGGPGKAWPLLVAAVDAPGDGNQRLGRDEMIAYHGEFANDEGVARGAPARLTRDGDRSLASDGAPVGTQAPDFLLEPLGGGAKVALSDFEGERPVALIFGSYT